MRRQSKRTSAPTPLEIPPQGAPPVQPPRAQPILPPGFPSMVGPGTWFAPRPPQSMVSSSVPSGSNGGSAVPRSLAKNVADTDVQAWGADPHPPGGFLNFLTNAQNPAQAASNAINVNEEDHSDCARTEKRLLWTKEEDLRLVGAWLNNSNDPIGSNYKKNEQYWKAVAAFYNSTTPKNRARLPKQIKSHFGRIKTCL